MRFGIISDIHSNLEGLESVLRSIRAEGVDHIVCLGDIVGYGSNPNECIELLRSATPHVLLGNHDEAAFDLSRTEYFNPFARIAAEWTAGQLSEENSAFLRELPLTIDLGGLSFVHSSPYQPEEWHYILSPADAQMNFTYFAAPLCFIGHTHVPAVFSEDIWARDVIQGKKSIVNVGSVGQPRDSDWRSSFGVFDSETWIYKNLRTEYDVKRAADKIRKAGLPKPLADRLLIGR